jgi:hypothetical protein
MRILFTDTEDQMYREKMLGSRYNDNASCPLCDVLAYFERDSRTGDVMVVCPACGKFCLTEEAWEFLAGLKVNNCQGQHKLSHIMRTVSERAFGKRDNSFFPAYKSDDLHSMLDRPEAQVREKLNSLLSYLGKLSEFPGQSNEFDSSNDYTVLGAKNYQEADFYLQSLAQQGLISLERPYTGKSGARFTVSSAGWVELERIAQSGGESSNAFIAMWFDSSRSEFDAAINQAIADAGYIPIRIDRVEHLNRIDDEIIARIRQSKFLVADFSGQRNGVYFEAGFMLGLGRPVIWVCEESDLENVHFDTRQYNTIAYTSADDLRVRLKTRIEANLGKGPNTSVKMH